MSSFTFLYVKIEFQSVRDNAFALNLMMKNAMSHLIKIYTVSNPVIDLWLIPLFVTMDVSKFHLKNSGLKGLKRILCYLNFYWVCSNVSTEQFQSTASKRKHSIRHISSNNRPTRKKGVKTDGPQCEVTFWPVISMKTRNTLIWGQTASRTITLEVFVAWLNFSWRHLSRNIRKRTFVPLRPFAQSYQNIQQRILDNQGCEESDQTARMRRLISVFVDGTSDGTSVSHIVAHSSTLKFIIQSNSVLSRFRSYYSTTVSRSLD